MYTKYKKCIHIYEQRIHIKIQKIKSVSKYDYKRFSKYANGTAASKGR